MTELREYAELMAEFGLTRLEYEKDGALIVLERQTTVATAVAATTPVAASQKTAAAHPVTASTVDGTHVTAPIVGTVYSAREPGAEPFVTVGQSVKKGETVCVIEAMKMFCEIAAPCDGTVAEICFENGELAEFGATLLTIS